MKKFIFLTPVFNDWDNLKILLEKIETNIEKLNFKFELIIINDCSTNSNKIKFSTKKIIGMKIINLYENVGSQRAIALGLRFISEKFQNQDKVIIIDSDGQDNPNIIPEIIELSEKNPDKVITVNRMRRTEPLWFRILYELHYYTLILFTGKKIRFGNFGLISIKNIKIMLQKSDLWGAYPAAITKSFQDTIKIFRDRDKRYSGETKMNIRRLFLHSIRVFSIFKFRILFFSFIYSSLFYLLANKVNGLFYSLIMILVMGNILTFVTSLNYKKNFDFSFDRILRNKEN